MSKERAGMLILKGMISDMNPEDRQTVDEAVSEIKQVIARHGDLGQFALSYVALELAAEGQG